MVNGALRGNGSGAVSQAAAADLSNGTTGIGSVVLAASPTLTTPTIASIVNTNSLTVPTGGGTFHTVLAADGSAHATGVDTTEDTLAAITLQANSIGRERLHDAHAVGYYRQHEIQKSLRIARFSGGRTARHIFRCGPAHHRRMCRRTQSRCNTLVTRRISRFISGVDGAIGVATVALTTSSVDTTAATTILITGQKGSAGETLQLDSYQVLL